MLGAGTEGAALAWHSPTQVQGPCVSEPALPSSSCADRWPSAASTPAGPSDAGEAMPS